MRALIFEQAGTVGAGALDVAGRALLVRQLQWLRGQELEDVVVEIASGAFALERAELLLGVDPLTLRCQVIPTRGPVGVAELAARAGIQDGELFLALPADLVVHADLALSDRLTTYAIAAPPFAAQQPGEKLALRTRAAESAQTTSIEHGWALRVGDLATAHALSCAMLNGHSENLLVHAAELRPGIWLARGARVSEDATLLPPVLIGAEARVFAGAHLGPNVVIGRRAVIEREAVLSEVSVAAGTLVGEGMRIHQSQVDARGTTSLSDHTRTEVDAPLQLASTLEQGPLLTSRLIAACLVALLLLPWLVALGGAALLGKRGTRRLPFRHRPLHVGTLGLGLLDAVPALLDVVLGRRDLVGVAEPAALEIEATRSAPQRAGALDISRSLAPNASTSTLLCMWRWYLRNKTAGLDRKLWWRQQFGARPERALGRERDEARKSTAPDA